MEPNYYHPFWYARPSTYDPGMKKYDGIGFKPLLQTIEDPRYGMSNLRPAKSFIWPPHPERTVARDVMLTCPDLRTAVSFKMEAFDLSDDGDSITYFRRFMCILDRILPKSGIAIENIIHQLTKEEREDIYPPLSQILVRILVEAPELMGYLKVDDSKAGITEMGKKKLEDFKRTLSAEERRALQL